MLSQINAARGDDAMQVDEDESSDESEEEVKYHVLCFRTDLMYGVG